MKTYATTLLLWLALLVGELHTLWEDSTKEVNWILSEKVMMPIQWNVKYAGDELMGILVALSIVFYRGNRINNTAAKVFFLYYIADCVFYFYNFKREGYDWIYTFLMISWIIIYNRNGRINTSKRQGTLIKTER